MTIKTRFAPSPTGFLHVGGARTALYSWLVAQAAGGEFVLRIEDTDLERSTQEAIDAIMEGMTWLGLEWTEGPHYQTKRFDRYKDLIQQLVDEDKAYRCYCTSEELDVMREAQMAKGEKPRYTGVWRDRTDYPEDKPYVIRFRNPQEGTVVFEDHVRGRIEVANAELDDLIILRSDGSPTYNFCVVVDDWDMGISHVVRGEDHVNNTPRQINILKALNAPIPEYAHVAMILGDDGAKLSKRHGAVSVMQYRDEGYLPHALLNYLVRLGWSHGDQEIFSLAEMKELFSLDSINKAASAFNTDKLVWLNQHYIKTSPVAEVKAHLQWHLDQQGVDTSNGPAIEDVITAQADRVKTLKELVEISRYFYHDFSEFDEKAAKKHLRGVAQAPLELVQQKLSDLSEWTPELIQAAINTTAEELEVGMGKVGMPLRVAVTGAGNSPSLDITLNLLGKERSVQRISQALSFIEQRVAG